MGLILLICVVTFLTIPVLFTVQTARKVGKPTIGPRATRSPEWREAMRELDELESDPSLRYFQPVAYQPVPDSEKVHAAVNHRRPDHDVDVVRNACGDVVYSFRTGDARSFPGDASPAALITAPKSHPSLRYFPMENLDQFLPLVIGYQPFPDSEKVQMINRPSPRQRFIEAPEFPPASYTSGVLTVPDTCTEAQLRELREYFLTSPTRGRILTS